jgi:hypothetical protein
MHRENDGTKLKNLRNVQHQVKRIPELVFHIHSAADRHEVLLDLEDNGNSKKDNGQ